MKHKAIPVLALLVLVLAALACGGTAPTATPVPPAPTEQPVVAGPEPTAAVEPTTVWAPEVLLEPGWCMYTNGNAVREIALHDGTLWAATGGGIVAWDLASGAATKYTTLDGLPTNDIQAVTVCPIPDTRVVFGTEAGLTLYDPASDTWEQWTPQNSGMQKLDVATLDCEPEADLLLVGYTWGLDVYDGSGDQWIYLDEDDGLATDWVDQAAFVGSNLWIVSSFGVSVVHEDGSVTGYLEDSSDIPDEGVESVAGDAAGNVWLAAFDGLIKFSGGTWTLYNSDSVEEFPFLDAFVEVLAAPDGTIWVGNTFGTICQFDPQTESCRAIYEDQPGMVDGLNDMFMDGAGHVYYCDDGEGISTFDGGAWRAFQLDERPVGNRYTAVAATPDGTVWLGGGFGLQTLDGSEANPNWQHNTLDGNGVNTFHLGAEGIWIGHGAGASFAPYGSDTWTNLYKASAPGEGIFDGGVTAIAEDGTGRVWFGTNRGLTVWDGQTYAYYDLLNDEERAEELSARSVYALLADGSGVWVGAYGALFRFNENDEATRWDSELPGLLSIFTPSAHALARDADGNVLLGIGSRLLRYRDGSFEEVVTAPGEIYSIVVDGPAIWLGMYSKGVYHYDGSQWTPLTAAANGLPSDHFGNQGLALDSFGSIWFAGTEGGLGRYVPSVDNPLPIASAAARTSAPATGVSGSAGGDTLSQWAVAATASSQYGSDGWSAAQATGQPDTAECGDFTTAWASAASDGLDWIELSYATPVVPAQINIYETHSPGFIVQVSVKTVDGMETPVWQGQPRAASACPRVFTVDVQGFDQPVNSVVIVVDQSAGGNWNEIDAVELVGLPASR